MRDKTTLTLPALKTTEQWEKVYSIGLLLVVLVGIGLRLAYVNRPLDHRLRSPWRQADYVQIARNFYRGDMNIFYPQIDWREDTPGYVEAEFPFLPWTGALLYRVFGYHEEILRVLSAVLGIASLLLFLALCHKFLPPIGTLFAVAAFAVNPLLMHLATAMQPEPVMLFLSLIAVALIWRWDERPNFANLLLASAIIAAAALAKAPAAYLGLLLAYAVLRKFGLKALRDVRIYVAALVCILPPLAWHVWAARFWLDYGNSLGLSNGQHFIGWDMLLPPTFLIGILKWETLGVFTPAGWLLVLAAFRQPRAEIEFFLVWYGAVWVFYIVAGRTTAADWAYYYHSASIVPGYLLMGAGFAAFVQGKVIPKKYAWLARHEKSLGGLLAVGTLVALIGATVVFVRLRDGRTDLLKMRTCGLEFAKNLPPTEMIVVTGGYKFDEFGNPGAYNVSMMFAWMDRKGFNYGIEELGIETLDRLAMRGGRYWIAHRSELERDNLKALVNQRYRLVAECSLGYYLYDLKS